MTEDDKLHEIARLLRKHSTRPLLKFPYETDITNLAREILSAAKGPPSLWTKWSADREELANRAVDVWVPLDDLRHALNKLPGQPLTAIDVEQRIYALRHEFGGYTRGPDKELKEEALQAYEEEKANGTEFIAILGLLETWTMGAEKRLARREAEHRKERIENDKRRAEARLRSGADCPWTALPNSSDLHCRKNARLFRLKELERDKSPLAPRFEVLEVRSFEDRRGTSIGRYRTRSDASKSVLEVAYNPDWT